MIGNTEEVSERVRMLQADIGLIEGHTNENELEIEPFMEDEMCIAASKSASAYRAERDFDQRFAERSVGDKRERLRDERIS